MEKQCIHCPPGSLKPYSEFWVSRNGRTKDGYMAICKFHAKESRKAYIKSNPEKVAQYNKSRYVKDPDRYNQCDSHRKASSTRRARRLNQFIEDVSPRAVYQMHGGMCGICKEFIADDFHVDHIVPLSKGGMHGYINVQPTHPKCNLRKGAKCQ